MIITASLFSSCSKAQSTVKQEKDVLNKNSILIVYLTRTKNTKTVAQIIHKQTGGKLIELELQNPYPANYKAIVDQVAKENETDFLPALNTKIDSIEKYDTVFIGFPTWGMQLPPPMKSFLSQYNLKGKTIIPFNTNAGYGIGSSFDKIKELCTECKRLERFSSQGGKKRDEILMVMEGEKKSAAKKEIQTWLKKIGILKN